MFSFLHVIYLRDNEKNKYNFPECLAVVLVRLEKYSVPLDTLNVQIKQ